MIKKLRIKLIIAAMASLFVVLFIIMGSIMALNYHNLIANADSILSILAENDGAFPDMSNFNNNNRPSTDEFHKPKPVFSPELPYESRYFSVFLNSDGTVISVNTGKIAAVDTSTAIEYAHTVWQ